MRDKKEDTNKQEGSVAQTSNNKSKSSNNNSYTDEQKLFIYGLHKLRLLETKENTEGLTDEDIEERKNIQLKLFKAIYKYGIKLSSEQMAKYRTANDAYADVFQDLYMKFQEVLMLYDPTRTTPTTYFKPYFREVTSKYLRDYSQHLTQNQATNVAKVRKAIRDLEQMNISPDVSMISRRSGLSLKVTDKTLNTMYNSTYADIDSVLDMSSKLPTPEEALLDSEKETEVITAIKSILTPKEVEYFYHYAGVDDELTFDGSTPVSKEPPAVSAYKVLTYKQFAEDYGIPIHEAKSIISGIIAKLSNSRVLQKYNPNSFDAPDPLMQFHDDNIADDAADEIIDSILGISDNADGVDSNTGLADSGNAE